MSQRDGLDFEGFKKLAGTNDLSESERLGFRQQDRAGIEPVIFSYLRRCLLSKIHRGSMFLDIGCGFGCLQSSIQKYVTGELAGQYHAVDSSEMLNNIMVEPGVCLHAGEFPAAHQALVKEMSGKFTGILAFSVLHYVVGYRCPFKFIDSVVSLLADGGIALIADIPNFDARIRFLRSFDGWKNHMEHYPNSDYLMAANGSPLPGEITDDTVLALMARARRAGCDTELKFQPEGLPYANRREDLWIYKRKASN